MKICAVVVSRNRRDLLRGCLTALRSQSRPVNCIAVVDNASDDGTGAMIVQDFPNVQLLRMTTNIGSAGGFWAGVKWAYENEFDWFWLMDDDVVPTSSALEELVETALHLPDVGYLCSRVIGITGLSMNVPHIDDRPGFNRYPQWEERLSEGLARVRTATFVSLMVPRHAVAAHGLPIKELFIWSDDIEFTARLAGTLPCYLVGRSVVRHLRLVQESLDILNEPNLERIRNFRLLYRNTTYCMRQHFGRKRLLKFLISSGFTMIRAMSCPPHRLHRVANVFVGVAQGLVFRPQVEHVDR